MADIRELSVLIDRLYAAAHGEEEWDGALNRLCDLCGARAATVEFHDVVEGAHLFSHSIRLDQALMPVYVREFAGRNPRVRHLQTSRQRIAFDHLFMTETEMDRDPFYAGFLRPQGLRYFVSVDSALFDRRVKGAVALQFGGKISGVQQEGIDFMTVLAPHFNRALGVFWRNNALDLDPEHLDKQLAAFSLTPAERRLARAVAAGERLPDYARRTGISINTAYTHYARVKGKLDCRSRGELVGRLASL
ncbi:MAG: helix-turn-helix transcriptional regulator [Nitratireductor sp.]|nr:helix-turn-helix transcriptional regulator [Nitratireductor sp.]